MLFSYLLIPCQWWGLTQQLTALGLYLAPRGSHNRQCWFAQILAGTAWGLTKKDPIPCFLAATCRITNKDSPEPKPLQCAWIWPQSLAYRSNALFLHHVPPRDVPTTAVPESAQGNAVGEKTPLFPLDTYPCREPHQRHAGRYVPRMSRKGKYWRDTCNTLNHPF